MSETIKQGRIHKISLQGTVYEIDAIKDIRQDEPDGGGFIRGKTHYIKREVLGFTELDYVANLLDEYTVTINGVTLEEGKTYGLAWHGISRNRELNYITFVGGEDSYQLTAWYDPEFDTRHYPDKDITAANNGDTLTLTLTVSENTLQITATPKVLPGTQSPELLKFTLFEPHYKTLDSEYLTLDNEPKAGSINPVTSNGIKDQIDFTQKYANSLVASVGLEFRDDEETQTSSVIGPGTCTDTQLVIPRVSPAGYPVTEIADDAFFCGGDLLGIQEIYIPRSITSIGTSAFECDDSCGDVIVIFEEGSQLKTIGDNAFAGRGCKINFLPKGLESLGSDALNCFTGSITIPDSITRIGSYALENCTELILPQGFENIAGISPDFATRYFENSTSLTTVTGTAAAIKRLVDNFGYTIPNIVLTGESVPDCMFMECSGFKNVTLSDSVTSIGDEAFRGCSSLESITIGNGIASIVYSVFDGCSSLTSVVFGENSQLISIEKYAFKSCGSLTSITIPEGVTSIGNSAFNNCYNLRSITIPDSVTSIGNSAFSSCSSLTSVVFGENSQLTSIGDGAFSGCSSLESITLPDSITYIGSSVFSYCSNLKYFFIPRGVTGLSDNLVYQCPNLKAVFIPDTVKYASTAQAFSFEETNPNTICYFEAKTNEIICLESYEIISPPANAVWGAAWNFPAVNDKLEELRTDLDELELYADKIKFKEDLIFTESFGKYKPTATEPVTIPVMTDDMSLKDLLNNAFATDKDPTVSYPTVSLNVQGAGSYEVGSVINVRIDMLADCGSYQYGPETGITSGNWFAGLGLKDSSSRNNDRIDYSNADYFNESITVESDTYLQPFAEAAFYWPKNTDGYELIRANEPYTLLKNTVPELALSSSEFYELFAPDCFYYEGSSGTVFRKWSDQVIKAHRNMFIGTMATKPATMTSADIRAFTNTRAAGSTSNWALAVAAGAYRVVIAIPQASGKTLTKVLDVNDANTDIVGSFEKTTVNVEGANGYTAVPYDVYYLDSAVALKANTFNITIS